MDPADRLCADLGAVLQGPGGALGSADRLCQACVEMLDVDGAAISIVHDGVTRGTFGSSSELSRRLDEFQFTFGEGPCLEAVGNNRPVFAPDLGYPTELRWPAFTEAVLKSGVQAVYAFPISIAATGFGALDLFRTAAGSFSEVTLSGALWAAELAVLPLLDLMDQEVEWKAAGEGGDGWAQIASLERVEVYQATGMVMAQLDIGQAEALVRIRAYAFANDMTASDVAWRIVERRLRFDSNRGGEEIPRGGDFV